MTGHTNPQLSHARRAPQTGHLTGHERTFAADQVIVTKTDPKGHITYANEVFQSLSSLTERECLGAPHNLIRHPDMPRCIFDLMWRTIQDGREIFAYVLNRAMDGDHYWVHAHVTPSFNDAGEIIGYHSNRRRPERDLVQEHIIPLYAQLRAEERRHERPKQALAASTEMLDSKLAGLGLEYDRFVCTLGQDQ